MADDDRLIVPEPPREEARAPQSDLDAAAGVTPSGVEKIRAEVTDAASGVRTFSARQTQRARDLLARMYGLRRAHRLYPLEHPAVAEAARELFEVISAYHGEGVDVPLTFFEEEVLLGEQVLAEDSVLFDQLIRDMTAIGAGSVTFLRGLGIDEVVRFAGVIGKRYDEVAELPEGLATLLQASPLPNIVISAVNVVRDDVTIVDEDSEQAAKFAYTSALDLLRELERLIRVNQSFSAGHVKGAVRSLVDNVLRNRYAMLELSGLKSFDEYTFYHSINVAILSLALGSTLTRDYRFLSSLGVGALLHDIGKMSVPIETLNKTTPLTSEEWAELREHPVRGAEIATLTNGVDRASTVCILEHHMRYDLAGYPARSFEHMQHVTSRIVSVADAYDAMTSQRPYSAPRMQDEAMGIIVKNAGTALDPTLVRLFVDTLGYFPPRSVVLLSTGETAIVVSPSPSEPAKPVVRIIADSEGRITGAHDLDLSDASEAGGRTVVRCLDPTGMNVDVADFL
ncbi:MAG: HD domain-containing protein [Coriobacteriia bacterium]|nr:HD domain-containing protein [Coriobacteriia bacterium]